MDVKYFKKNDIIGVRTIRDAYAVQAFRDVYEHAVYVYVPHVIGLRSTVR